MISIQAARLHSPLGDLKETFDAIAHGRRASAPLAGSLLEQIIALTTDGPWMPDLVLFASTKGDGPMWIEDCLGKRRGKGGPGWIARQLGDHFSCEALAVSVACASGPGALAVASLAIEGGHFQRVLVIGGDKLMPMVTEGFASLRAIDPSGARPFDAERQGLALGETVAALWCSDQSTGPQFLSGWGLSCDANHLTGPDREGLGLFRACHQAALGRDQGIDLFIAHGTGTRYNDDAESHAYHKLSPDTPVTGWKGSLGHSLGSCGIAEAALACLSMQRQAVPGTCGLTQAGTAQPLRLMKQGLHPHPLQHIISANAGFGGLNGAVGISSTYDAKPPQKTGRAEKKAQFTFDSTGCFWTSNEQVHEPMIVWDDAIKSSQPGELPRFTSRWVTGQRDSSWGRMDHLCRLAVSLVYFAQKRLGPISAHTSLILMSDRGCAESDRHCEMNRQQGLEDPQRFAYTLPSTALGEISIRFGINGPAIALPGATDNQGEHLASWLIEQGQESVLLLRVEADSPPHLAWLQVWENSA